LEIVYYQNVAMMPAM